MNTKRHLPLLIVFCLGMCLCGPSFSQLQIDGLENLSLREGLSDRAVRAIVQDQDGFIWISTNNGLNRYDGYGFTIFDDNEDAEHKIAQSRIHQMEVLADGLLGLSNKDNLEFFEVLDPQSFVSKKIALGAANGIQGKPLKIFFEENGAVHVLTATPEGYAVLRSDENFRFRLVAEIPASFTVGPDRLKFLLGQSGHYWLLDEVSGLYKTDPGNPPLQFWPKAELMEMTQPSEVTYPTGLMHESIDGTLWLAPQNRLGVLSIRAGAKEIGYPEGLPQNETYFKIWEDHDGNVSIGTFLAYWKIKQLFRVKTNGEVESLQQLVDIESTIGEMFWPAQESFLLLGTYVGIFKVDLADRAVGWLLADRQLEDNQWDDGISIRGITGDGRGRIFISRELSAWYQGSEDLRPAQEIILRQPNGEKIDLWCCSNLVYDPEEIIWGGSCTDDRNGLLHRYDLKTQTTATFMLPGKTIRHMVRREDGTLVMATGAQDAESKLYFFSPKIEKTNGYVDADDHNPLEKHEPQFVMEAKNGDIWVGTVNGLIWIDPVRRASRLFNKENSQLSSDDVTAIHETSDGLLYLGTHNGLNIFDPQTGEVKSYGTNDGLSNNIIASIVPDGEGGYWLPTYYGLSYFDPETALFSNFSRDKGLTFNEFNRQAYYHDRLGQFYFGTINGINVFRNEDLKKAPFDRFRPQWAGISIYDQGVERKITPPQLRETASIHLRYSDDLVRFNFCLPVFENPKENRFAVWLEGRDKAWQYLGTKPFYELNNPEPGEYRLRVKAVAANGMWGEEELSVRLVVAEAFYQTLWFFIGLPLAILILGYAITKLAINRIRKREAEQTRVNKRFAELELQALQAQMNPHFVFNALGAIQYFIQNNNQKAADEYLGKFAKLMRLFLESSKNKYISLEEEIKLLSLYIELEQMRFEDKFAAEILVEDGIEPYAVELPSILIQPFVENAINHGLFNKSTNGTLRVLFTEGENGKLVCTITDDGIGRKKAEEMKKDSSRNYKSRGMQIVRERLEVLQEVDDVKINVSAEDLYPNATDPGTRVTIEVEDFD